MSYAAIWSAPGPLGSPRKLYPQPLSKRDAGKLREEGRGMEVRGGWALKPGDHTTTARARQLGLLSHRGPRVNHEVPASQYDEPPVPKWKQQAAKESHTTVEELSERARELRGKVELLHQTNKAEKPTTETQLGLAIISFDDKAIDLLLSKWDPKSKGELSKAEMRLNFRQASPPYPGLNVPSTECDAIFDRWDDDGGGKLDLVELKVALKRAKHAAEEWNNRPDPRSMYTAKLEKQAQLCDEAAAATQEANDLETALDEAAARLLARADVRLGRLLQKRMMLPGQVVVQWASSSGKHVGELSKADFRHAVAALFAGRKVGSSAHSGSSSVLSTPTSSPATIRPESTPGMRPPGQGCKAPPAGWVPPDLFGVRSPATLRPSPAMLRPRSASSAPMQRPPSASPDAISSSSPSDPHHPPSPDSTPTMSLETSGATGLSPMTSATSQGPASPEHSPRSKAPEGRQLARRPSSAHLTSVGEIDEIFDAYDEDGGGYMDEEEAKTMVKGLRQAGLDAEREQRQREREARAARAKASKKALVAMAEMEPMPAELQPAVSATVPPVQKAKAEVPKAEDEGYEC